MKPSSVEKKSSDRRAADLNLKKVRSAVTNGRTLFAGDVDERGAWSRRFRDILRAHYADLGGQDALSEGQRSLVRRAAMLQIQLELVEAKWAERDGQAKGWELLDYQRVSSSLRRLLESLGLNHGRKPRDVTPTERALGYIRGEASP